jgi:hypothetical protein
MKVYLSTTIALPPETVWAEVQTADLLMYVAWPLVRFTAIDGAEFDMFSTGRQYQVKLHLFGLLPFGAQWIVPSTHEPEVGEWPKCLRDNGHSSLISTWDHWITITPSSGGDTLYSDQVEIAAGVMTPVIWAFAQVFYRHRQHRWRRLARTFKFRRFIEREMVAFEQAKATEDWEAAWRSLERAHIVSQQFLALHLKNHWHMLFFAFDRRDGKEIAGQILRLILAPLGAMTGRNPVGNIGRSTVSAFAPMPIPEDLRRALEN